MTADRPTPARPRTDGGVWGSYVGYLTDLEAEVERLSAALEVTNHAAEADRDRYELIIDRVHAAEKAFLSRAVDAEHELERQRPVIKAARLLIEAEHDVKEAEVDTGEHDDALLALDLAWDDLLDATNAAMQGAIDGSAGPTRTWSLPPEPGPEVTRVLDQFGQYFERQHDDHPGDDDIPAEAYEAAARAIHDRECADGPMCTATPTSATRYAELARRAVDAAAPHLVAAGRAPAAADISVHANAAHPLLAEISRRTAHLDRLEAALLEYATVCANGTGDIPAVDVAWKIRQIVAPNAAALTHVDVVDTSDLAVATDG